MQKEIKIVKSELLSARKEINHGFSTKIGSNRKAPFFFNLSVSVGDDEKRVADNRFAFFTSLGCDPHFVATQYQVHGTGISIIDKPGFYGENDAMITDTPNVVLTVTSADCVPILMYDPVVEVIAAVHSGWRGTSKKIALHVIDKLKEKFNSKPENLLVYLGPSISQKNYEVGAEFAEIFPDKYLLSAGEKYLLDVPECNRDLILSAGVKTENLEICPLCSFEEEYLHSYRRDGKLSGRAMGAIMLAGE